MSPQKPEPIYTVSIFLACCLLGTLMVGAILGYQIGTFSHPERDNRSPAIVVPSDYLAGVRPVPNPSDRPFSFATFTFVDDNGVKMSVPVPSEK